MRLPITDMWELHRRHTVSYEFGGKRASERTRGYDCDGETISPITRENNTGNKCRLGKVERRGNGNVLNLLTNDVGVGAARKLNIIFRLSTPIPPRAGI